MSTTTTTTTTAMMQPQTNASMPSAAKACEEFLPPLPEDDESWKLVSSQKSRPTKKIDVFLGNVKPETTESSLAKYVCARAKPIRPSMAVHKVVMFSVKEGFDTATSRITEDARDLKMLLNRSFWPGQLYGRKWWYTERTKSNQQQ